MQQSDRIELAPVPASRLRVPFRGKPYYPMTYVAWRESASAYLPTPAAALRGLCSARVEVACRRLQKLTSATPSGDVDNYAKAALDAITAADIWVDDKQVVELAVKKRYSDKGEASHTHIVIEDAT